MFSCITECQHHFKLYVYQTWAERPHGDGLLVAGLSFTKIPPVGRRSPLLRTRGYVILCPGSRDGSVGSTLDCEPMCCRFESSRS